MVGIAFRSSGVTHDVQPYCRMDRAQKTGALPAGPYSMGGNHLEASSSQMCRR
jgi:hypothetical protein